MENKILFVDDETYILKMIARKLEDMDVEVFTTDDGKEALEIVQRENISVMFTDLMMAKMNGLTLVNEVTSINEDIVVVVLSGNSQTSAIVQTMNTNHVYKYLIKPWRIDEEAKVFIKNCLEEARKREHRKKEELDINLMIRFDDRDKFSDDKAWILTDDHNQVILEKSEKSYDKDTFFDNRPFELIETNRGTLKLFYA